MQSPAHTPGEPSAQPVLPYAVLSALGVLTALAVWAHWPGLVTAADRWANDPQYSHGFLVPPFAAYLLWTRRRMPGLSAVSAAPSALGFAGLIVGAAIRWVGAAYFINGLDLLALVPTLLGAVALLAGRRGFVWAWPAVGFLVFMIPLPYRLQTLLSGQLQQAGTVASTYLLQTLGLPAIAEGNVIVLDDVRIGVVEACSGLGMIVTCVALASAVALLVRCPTWIKLALIAAALPVSVLTNVARISGTAFLHHLDHRDAADTLYHDLAGWFMMPLALALIGFVYWYLGRLIVPRVRPGVADAPIPLSMG